MLLLQIIDECTFDTVPQELIYIDMFHAISLSIMCAYDTFTAASLNLLGHTLKWHRLDDGVMGGQSETLHASSTDTDELHFTGQINTQGGGFCR